MGNRLYPKGVRCAVFFPNADDLVVLERIALHVLIQMQQHPIFTLKPSNKKSDFSIATLINEE